MSNSSNEGSAYSAVFFWVIGCVCAFVILLCCIPACLRMQRRTNARNGSQTSQVAPAAVNGRSAQKDSNTEPAVAIAAETAGAGCCCAGGGSGDGGGCGGCGGGD